MPTARAADLRKNIIKNRAVDPSAKLEMLGSLDTADALRRRAEKLEADARRAMISAARRKDYRQRILAALADLDALGLDEAARRHEISVQALDLAHVARMQQNRAAERKNAEMMVMKLAGRGWSNRAIARHVVKPGGGRYHPASISRIIQRELRR